ncbi:protein-L-isoaspartate O-methyltransferase family protein [Streptomyces bacillaris]|uniref:protein-L-isoaspartate O-methyltransferase family protein n=1 Tax=Streptomyces bacillaris TaxID=68179 RepID=UPI003465398C
MVRTLNWVSAARSLADGLRASGDISSRSVYKAVASTPRHASVPTHFDNSGGVPTLWQRRTEEEGVRWLEPIYSNTSLVTELGLAEAVDAGWHRVPVSSSTQPSLTARMLEDLGIEPEDDVLDAGLGTGYQAALILKLVAGPDRLTACDISGTDAARDRLEALGHHPRIIEADATSWRWQRQFDKIIFSFGLPYVTDSIRTALAPGGRLIANVFGPMSAGLVLLEARSDGTLSGRFTEDGGTVMHDRREAGAVRAEPGERSGGTSGIPVEDFDNYHLKFLLSARLPGLDLQYGTEEGRPVRRLLLPDGRWGEVTYRAGHGAAGSYQDQGLWAVVEETWAWWVAHAKPSWDQFGLTVGPDGRHTLWHRSPDGDSWDVPTAHLG